MWKNYISVTNQSEVLDILESLGDKAQIIAGGTDLILEMGQGLHKDVDTLMDISRIAEMADISMDDEGQIHIGPAVTHTDVVGSALLRKHAMPLVQACWEVGSPQIRNRGTLIGNLVTASPANDTITPLMALSAEVVLVSSKHTRKLSLADFFAGVRKTVLQPDEFVAEVVIPAMQSGQKGFFIKHGLRRAQAISLINVAVVLDMENELIKSANITLGAVAPTIVHAHVAERWLVGKQLKGKCAEKAGELACRAAKPISDIRSSAEYRQVIVKTLVQRALENISQGNLSGNVPNHPVLMKNKVTLDQLQDRGSHHDAGKPIVTTINGEKYHLTGGNHKTLLRLLREDAKLLGSKETCGEGECGACTVIMDGALVNSCLVPAPRAHGAQILTVEGLVKGDQLHPIQEAFIDKGAVQCGYCTPGFLMSAIMLLEERSQPSREEIMWGLSGNLCRCTGYYKIIEAVEDAANRMHQVFGFER